MAVLIDWVTNFWPVELIPRPLLKEQLLGPLFLSAVASVGSLRRGDLRSRKCGNASAADPKDICWRCGWICRSCSTASSSGRPSWVGMCCLVTPCPRRCQWRALPPCPYRWALRGTGAPLLWPATGILTFLLRTGESARDRQTYSWLVGGDRNR